VKIRTTIGYLQNIDCLHTHSRQTHRHRQTNKNIRS